MGGGKATGVWLLNVLDRLKCEVLVSDGHYHMQAGDEAASRIYPELAGNGSEAVLNPIRTLRSSAWSGHGDITWSLVKANEPSAIVANAA